MYVEMLMSVVNLKNIIFALSLFLKFFLLLCFLFDTVIASM